MTTQLILWITNIYVYVRWPKPVWDHIRRQHRLPNVACPDSYTERMLWRRLFDHNPMFVTFTDKLATKEYCQQRCGDLEAPETLWVGQNAADIPDQHLTGDVFVKTNHGYNHNYPICAGRFDRDDLIEKTDAWMRSRHGEDKYVWSYSQVPPKLFVEKTIGDAGADLLDVNFRVSNGAFIAGCVVGHNKLDNMWAVYVDEHCNAIPGPNDLEGAPFAHLPEDMDITTPYRRMVEYAKQLSIGVDYVRVDFMLNGDRVYAGEITVYPAVGIHEIYNPPLNEKIKTGWDLRDAWFCNTQHTGLKRLYAAALNRALDRRAARPATEPIVAAPVTSPDYFIPPPAIDNALPLPVPQPPHLARQRQD